MSIENNLNAIWYGVCNGNKKISPCAGLFLTSRRGMVDFCNLCFEEEIGIMINSALYFDVLNMPPVLVTAHDARGFYTVQQKKLPTMSQLIELQRALLIVNNSLAKVRRLQFMLPSDVISGCWSEETAAVAKPDDVKRLVFIEKSDNVYEENKCQFLFGGKLLIAGNNEAYVLDGGRYQQRELVLWGMKGRSVLLAVRGDADAYYLFYRDPESHKLIYVCENPYCCEDGIFYSVCEGVFQLTHKACLTICKNKLTDASGCMTAGRIRNVYLNEDASLVIEYFADDAVNEKGYDIYRKDAAGIYQKPE